VAAVQPPGRFATLSIDESSQVTEFREKHIDEVGWINGGFFVLEPKVIDLISDDSIVWEREPLELLASKGQLVAFKHLGFWKPMDTLREKRELESLYKTGDTIWLQN
jgi:glucose-1-phosphate cytidylyltransferase